MYIQQKYLYSKQGMMKFINFTALSKMLPELMVIR